MFTATRGGHGKNEINPLTVMMRHLCRGNHLSSEKGVDSRDEWFNPGGPRFKSERKRRFPFITRQDLASNRIFLHLSRSVARSCTIPLCRADTNNSRHINITQSHHSSHSNKKQTKTPITNGSSITSIDLIATSSALKSSWLIKARAAAVHQRYKNIRTPTARVQRIKSLHDS